MSPSSSIQTQYSFFEIEKEKGGEEGGVGGFLHEYGFGDDDDDNEEDGDSLHSEFVFIFCIIFVHNIYGVDSN